MQVINEEHPLERLLCLWLVSQHLLEVVAEVTLTTSVALLEELPLGIQVLRVDFLISFMVLEDGLCQVVLTLGLI